MIRTLFPPHPYATSSTRPRSIRRETAPVQRRRGQHPNIMPVIHTTTAHRVRGIEPSQIQLRDHIKDEERR